MQKLVRFDWAIKYLLRNKANFDILEGFLSKLQYEIGKEEGFREGYEVGVDEGIQKGDKSARLQMAQSLKKAGFSLSDIIEHTGLAETEI